MLSVAATAVLAAVVLIALGGSGRHTATHDSAPRGGHGTVVQRVAGYLGIAPAEVRRRMRSGETLGQIAATAGTGSRKGLIESLYATEAAAIRARHLPRDVEAARLRELRRTLVTQVDHARRRPGLLRASAAYLGLDEAALAAKLANGRTLAQVAASTPGRSRSGLLDALVATRRRTIERALAEKAISAAAARRAIARLRDRAERQVALSGG